MTEVATEDWSTLAAATIAELKNTTLWAFIQMAEDGATVAVCCRETQRSAWHKIILNLEMSGEDRSWHFFDDEGNYAHLSKKIDQSDILQWIEDGMCVAPDDEQASDNEEDDDADDEGGSNVDAATQQTAHTGPLVDDTDADGMRATFTGRLGTLRTREGSKDHNIPANKVLFIFDDGAGDHMLLKLEETKNLLSEVQDDETDERVRAAALLRGSPGSCVLGTLLGETRALPICPTGVTELCNYAGVQIKERNNPILQGDAVSCTSIPDDTSLFFTGAVIGTQHKQRRMNALLYSGTEDAIKQVGLMQVLQHQGEPAKMDEEQRRKVVTALAKYELVSLKAAQERSVRAEKAADKAAAETAQADKAAKADKAKADKAKADKAKAGKRPLTGAALMVAEHKQMQLQLQDLQKLLQQRDGELAAARTATYTTAPARPRLAGPGTVQTHSASAEADEEELESEEEEEEEEEEVEKQPQPRLYAAGYKPNKRARAGVSAGAGPSMLGVLLSLPPTSPPHTSYLPFPHLLFVHPGRF